MPGPSVIPSPARMAKDRDHDFPPRNWTAEERKERREFLRGEREHFEGPGEKR